MLLLASLSMLVVIISQTRVDSAIACYEHSFETVSPGNGLLLLLSLAGISVAV